MNACRTTIPSVRSAKSINTNKERCMPSIAPQSQGRARLHIASGAKSTSSASVPQLAACKSAGCVSSHSRSP